ncbi:ATP-dependent helicase [Patescibacteria group bacterium]|nr:ATP-dependent helicase [Patescibacteria group bacterium]
MTSFAREYQKLNKNQKIAVDSIDGPVMVMAGPGTGKTQVLTLRIANILKKTDTPPSSILALTFTDAASNEMRTRLVNLIGKPAYSVQISTFHSFCQSVILENPDLFIVAEETEHLQDLDRTKILQKIIKGNNFSYLKPLNAPYYYVLSIIENIRTLKREGVSPEELKKTLTGPPDKNLDLQKIYSLYQQELVKKGRFDFEDMINWVVDKFEKDPNLLLSYQERLSYFLVDEYQDTNSAQNQLVFNLASFWAEKANLFVVGDPNQSIFRFQGASLENTKEFISRFPNTTLINLNQNYRSTQTVLNSAHSVIKNNYPKAIKLKSNLSGPGKLINTAHFTHSIFEDYFIAKNIKNLINKGVKPQNIAIIVRHNKDLDDISSTLKKFNIPFTIKGTQDLLEQPLIKKLIIFLTIISNSPHQHLDSELFTLLNYTFFEIEPLNILKTAKKAADNHTHLASYILSDRYKIPADLKTFFTNLNNWQKLSANLTLPEFFEKLIQQSGILNHLLKQKNKADELHQLNMFFTQIKNMAFQDKSLNLSKLLSNINALREQKIKTTISSPITLKESVTLTTAHKAKGLEWDHVYIYRCVDGKWGNPRIRQLIKLPSSILEFAPKENHQAEERRLFYVAITRTKKTLNLTSASQYTTDYGTQNTLPSSFITEIPSKLTKKIKPKNAPIKTLKKLLTPPITNPSTVKEKEYLMSLVKDIKLSVTALTTFLDCAYKFKLNNLYRLPKAKEAYLVFGTAVHTALEKYFSNPKLKFLLSQFKKALTKEVLTPQDFSIRLKHGQDVLTAYHNLHSTNLNPIYALEKYFGYSASSNCRLGDISLVGKIDKIDILDQDKKLAKVIDFKTGKPKTKGEIEGTTKSSTGYLKRQLVFYALLAKLDKYFPLRVTQFELDFVESPFLKNKSGQMTFTVSEKEIEDLKIVIKQTMKKIRSLKFPRAKDTSVCHRCEFRDHCYPQGIPKTIL